MQAGRRGAAFAALVAALVAVTACAAEPVPAAISPSAPSATAVVTPTPTAPPTLEEQAAALVADMSVREQAATVVMGHIPTTDAAALQAYMATTGVGGFILMGANIPADEAQLQVITSTLTTDPALPPLIAIDQEGGDVSRLPWDDFASALTLKDLPADQTGAAFVGRADLLSRAGIGVNFGIVADVAADPSSFIYRRSLGTTPEASAERVTAAVRAEDGTVLSTLKHFPGHGAATGDSHSVIPSTPEPLEEWTATDAVPFRAGIDAGADLLMFGHLAFTAVDAAPASLSTRWHRIARDDLGFDGVMITDDLGMLQASGIDAYADPVANAVTALAAGNDMVLVVLYSTAETAPQVADGIAAAVESGTLPAQRLADAAEHVVSLRLQLASARSGPGS